MEYGKDSIRRHSYSYIGRSIGDDERCLVLYTGGRMNPDDERAVMLSAMEAAADGWRIIVNGRWRSLEAAVTGCFAVDGKLSALRYDDVGTLRMGELERGVLMLRGCIFSAAGTRGELGYEANRKLGDGLLASLADACIFVNEVPRDTLSAMLDSGAEVAVFRGALRTAGGRLAAVEGAPVIDTYSSWRESPSCIAWTEPGNSPCLLYLGDKCYK